MAIGASTPEVPLPRLEALWEHLGRRVPIQLSARLNGKSETAVYRVFLPAREEGIPASVIVKWCREPASATAPGTPMFREEVLSYRFLSRVRASFAGCARLLASDLELLVLEDLGEPGGGRPSESGTYDRLAATLAPLHAATAGREELYRDTRRQAGLAETAEENHNLRKANGLFAAGSEMLRQSCRAVGLPEAGLAAALGRVRRTITRPGEFAAFIHNDCTFERQAVARGDRLYLVDFERAHYSHALLDVCCPLVGDIQWNLARRCYDYFDTNFTLAFAAVYRRLAERQRGGAWSDEVWNEALGAALLHRTLQVIGRLVVKSGVARLGRPPGRILLRLLEKRLGFLEELRVQPEAAGILRRLLAAAGRRGLDQ